LQGFDLTDVQDAPPFSCAAVPPLMAHPFYFCAPRWASVCGLVFFVFRLGSCSQDPDSPLFVPWLPEYPQEHIFGRPTGAIPSFYPSRQQLPSTLFLVDDGSARFEFPPWALDDSCHFASTHRPPRTAFPRLVLFSCIWFPPVAGVSFFLLCSSFEARSEGTVTLGVCEGQWSVFLVFSQRTS